MNKYILNFRVKITYHLFWIICATFCIGLIYVVNQVFLPIKNFPVNKNFEVEKGQSGEEIFNKLQSEGFIKSVFWSKVVLKLNSNIRLNAKFYPGEYSFETPISLYRIVFEITKRPVSLAVLIPEGFTKKQIADRLVKYIKKFDKKDFLTKAKEGYLFPDTYYFYSFATVDEILVDFNNRYNQNMLQSFGRLPTKDEVIIASMLEREARDPEDMKIISGIIQNRLKINMALQLDATVLYGQGAWKERTLYSDLKHKSDYNTYQNTGLPIGPISNPGINALRAAINPKKNDYIYYLTGKDGKMYYAKTHEEHVKNKLKYLR
jgi:UPF0755 protein